MAQPDPRRHRITTCGRPRLAPWTVWATAALLLLVLVLVVFL